MARLDYLAPGVYIQEVDRGSRPISGVQTNIAGFIGFTEAIRGGAQPGQPKLVTSWNEYLQYFAKEGSDGFPDDPEYDPYLPHAVNGWFLNGGARCWVVSLATGIPKSREDLAQSQDAQQETAATIIRTSTKQNSLKVKLRSDQPYDRPLTITIVRGEPKPRLMPSDAEESPDEASANSSQSDFEGEPVAAEFFSLIVTDREEGRDLEKFENLTMNQNPQEFGYEAGHYVVEEINQKSDYIFLEDLTDSRKLALTRRPGDGQYELTPLPVLPTRDNLQKYVQGGVRNRRGLQGLFEIDEITMVACPDLMWAYEKKLLNEDQVHGIMHLMVSLCENAAPNPPNRMVVLDPPPRLNPQEVVHWLDKKFNRRSMFAALYYPWIKVANPAKPGKSLYIPPSGHMMGVWSRTDETRGVYKAPANEVPKGVLGLAHDCNFREQEYLNPKGINCIRTFPDRGIRVWGARTLAELDKTEWRYINVRRLMSYIEKSIEQGTQWVVFEPNDPDLWARVRRTVHNFLERLWREGALFGETPDQAFYVKCDGDINPEEDLMLGRLNIEVGVRPVKPAEFVVFRISQWNGQVDN